MLLRKKNAKKHLGYRFFLPHLPHLPHNTSNTSFYLMLIRVILN